MIALDKYGRQWKLIQKEVPTRTTIQIRSHAQKYFAKIQEKQERSLMKEMISQSNLKAEGNELPLNLVELEPKSSSDIEELKEEIYSFLIKLPKCFESPHDSRTLFKKIGELGKFTQELDQKLASNRKRYNEICEIEKQAEEIQKQINDMYKNMKYYSMENTIKYGSSNSFITDYMYFNIFNKNIEKKYLILIRKI